MSARARHRLGTVLLYAGGACIGLWIGPFLPPLLAVGLALLTLAIIVRAM